MLPSNISLIAFTTFTVLTNTVLASNGQCVCEVRGTAFLRENPSQSHRETTHQFDCFAAPGETTFDKIGLDVDMEDAFYIRSEPAFREGKWFIEFPCEWIVDGKLPREKNDQVHELTRQEVAALYNRTRRLRGNQSNKNDYTPDPRRRLSNVGKQQSGIVIVHAADVKNPMTAAQAESMFYKSSAQFKDCSNGAMELVKKDNTVYITLPKRISEYTSNSVDDDLNKMICQFYGYGTSCQITRERDLDHILFSLPFGLSDDSPGAFWAKGSAGDSRRFSVYGGGTYSFEGQQFRGGFFVPSTIMHELGHNYRLGHATDPRDNGDYAYGDMTTHMGGGSETKKCFNGYNYYVLGWHQQQTNEISLGQAQTYNLKGISHLGTGGVVNIKADKYFITYNLKRGINSGIDNQGRDEDYTDEVLIHEGRDIKFGQTISAAYYNTALVGSLKNAGDMFSVKVGNRDLRVQLCSIDRSDSNGVNLSIGLDSVNCSNNGPINRPQGMRTLNDGVPASGLSGAEDDILEFIMEIPNNPNSVTCTTSGGSGDVDLLMNFLSSPQILYSSDVNACYSRGLTTSNTCTSTKASGQYLYVVLEADTAFSGVTLQCSASGGSGHPATTPPPPTPPAGDEDTGNVLVSGVPKRNIAIAVNGGAFYTMPMPPNAESVSCSISGGTGDADLYTRWDRAIDLSNKDVNTCVPYIPGSEETCDATQLSPMGNVLHVAVDAYRAVTGLTLQCDVVLSTPSAPCGDDKLPECPFTAKKKVIFQRTAKKRKTVLCSWIASNAKRQKNCSKKVVNSNLKVQDICIRECAAKTKVCTPPS